MNRFGLYYPHIHVRDDNWLKYGALYWPKIYRFRPRRYPVTDSDVAQEFHRANFLVDLEPYSWAALDTAEPFFALLDEYGDALQDRFGLHKIETWGLPPEQVAFGALGNYGSVEPEDVLDVDVSWLDPRFGFVHVSKLDTRLLDAAVDHGLAVTGRGRGGTWVGMHPELATVYSVALAERVATDNHLDPITDRILSHTAMSGWTLERLAQVLLDLPLPAPDEPRGRRDLSEAFVFLAFETVVPANLDRVPVDKILELRAELGPELDGFRTFVDDQVQRLAAFEEVRDPQVFEEYLHAEVRQTVERKLTELEERLRGAGLESTRALANVKSVALPPLAALAAEAVGVPPALTVPTVVAACVVGVPLRWRRARRDTTRESPVGYLLQLKRAIGPDSFIDKLRRNWPI